MFKSCFLKTKGADEADKPYEAVVAEEDNSWFWNVGFICGWQMKSVLVVFA